MRLAMLSPSLKVLSFLKKLSFVKLFFTGMRVLRGMPLCLKVHRRRLSAEKMVPSRITTLMAGIFRKLKLPEQGETQCQY